MPEQKKKQKNLSFAEQYELYCKMRREGTLTPLDDDEISLGMINIDWSNLGERLKQEGNKQD